MTQKAASNGSKKAGIGTRTTKNGSCNKKSKGFEQKKTSGKLFSFPLYFLLLFVSGSVFRKQVLYTLYAKNTKTMGNN